MIQVILNNEYLDIEAGAVVTFKKSQLLNGIQEKYSYSNNFNGQNSAKNRRLLGINYLPSSKAKAMTSGYDVDVIMNGCIFLKKQKLKVQKETEKAIPMYLIFSDSLFVAKAKETLMSQIDTGANYTKNLPEFLEQNDVIGASNRTAPISAQDSSGFVVVEEVPILLNIKDLVLRVFEQMGYAYTGDILTDTQIGEWYTSSNVGKYGPDGTPQFDKSLTAYDFIIDFLETFNGYIEVSDSSKLIGLYFWKNIEDIKKRFIDYSAKFVNFTEYGFEGGLAKTNTLSFSDSPDYFNGFFDNNKSILDKREYLNSGFGAGSLRLFSDEELDEDGLLEPRVNGEITEPQTMNLFKFESFKTSVPVYMGGVLQYVEMYKAYTPNILEIFLDFHKAYTDNIALPTVGQLRFRYDAIMLSEFKMWQVFFIKQLSAYWLPLEVNFTTKKDEVKIKSLMIEKTPVDAPVVFDLSMSIDFYGEGIINDLAVLYAAYNTSPADTMIITGADLTKNRIFVNGAEVLAFPASFDVSAVFEFKAQGIEPLNVLSNSDIFFQFISQAGGISRIGKINIAHNGYANYMSEFRSPTDTVYDFNRTNVGDFSRILNYSAKITTPINILNTLAPAVGEVGTTPDAINDFKTLSFVKASNVKLVLTVEDLIIRADTRGGMMTSKSYARTDVKFLLYKNNADLMTVYSNGAYATKEKPIVENEVNDIFRVVTFNVEAGDTISIGTWITGAENIPVGNMDGSTTMKNVIWKFYVTEQI